MFSNLVQKSIFSRRRRSSSLDDLPGMVIVVKESERMAVAMTASWKTLFCWFKSRS